MTNITIDLGRNINAQDLLNLRKRLQSLGPEDEIIIRMEAADAHQADNIIEELVGQGFDYQPHGGHEREYYLIARKRIVH